MGGKIAGSKAGNEKGQSFMFGVVFESLMFILINISFIVVFFMEWIHFEYQGAVLIKLFGMIDLHGGDTLSPYSVLSFYIKNLLEDGLNIPFYHYAVGLVLILPVGGLISFILMLCNQYRMSNRIILITSILMMFTLATTAYIIYIYGFRINLGFLFAVAASITGLVFSIICLPKKGKANVYHMAKNDSTNSSSKSSSKGKRKGSILGNTGEYHDTRFVLKEDTPVFIGRDASQCQVKLTGITISRKHCCIRYSSEKNCYYVTDYSTNGTFFDDGQRLLYGEEVLCKRGTMIRIGEGNKFILE